MHAMGNKPPYSCKVQVKRMECQGRTRCEGPRILITEYDTR
jgi:hypothetical protein